MTRRSMVWTIAMLTACARGEPFELTAWTQDLDADPFRDHAPAEVSCIGLNTEEGVLEVDTAVCPYAVVSQPALRRLRKGERLVGGMSHDDLFAEDPASAHAALSLDGEIIWEAAPRIPTPPQFHTLDVTLDRAVPEGALLVFHLHNHGINNYRLLPVEIRDR